MLARTDRAERNRFNTGADDSLQAKRRDETDRHGAALTAVIGIDFAYSLDPRENARLETWTLHRLDQFVAR